MGRAEKCLRNSSTVCGCRGIREDFLCAEPVGGWAGLRNAHAIPLRFVSVEESVRISSESDRWADGQG